MYVLVSSVALLYRIHASSTLFPYTTLFRSAPIHSYCLAHIMARPRTIVAPQPLGTSLPCSHKGDLFLSEPRTDRKSTRLNSSHLVISYAVFCLKKKTYRQYINYTKRTNVNN